MVERFEAARFGVALGSKPMELSNEGTEDGIAGQRVRRRRSFGRHCTIRKLERNKRGFIRQHLGRHPLQGRQRPGQTEDRSIGFGQQRLDVRQHLWARVRQHNRQRPQPEFAQRLDLIEPVGKRFQPVQLRHVLGRGREPAELLIG